MRKSEGGEITERDEGGKESNRFTRRGEVMKGNGPVMELPTNDL